MKIISLFSHTPKVVDTHEKPWGGVYARRMWRWMLAAAGICLLLSGWIHYRIYLRYTEPVQVSSQSLAGQLPNLDKVGLDKAVADIKEKESRFNEYLTRKIEITDPAK